MAKKIIAAAAMLAAATFAQAQSASVTVTGTVTPSTCTMSLGGSGIAAFGNISATTAKTWPVAGEPARYFGTTSQNVSLAINCSAATKMALRIIDNRAGTASPTAATDPSSYGLGTYTAPGGVQQKIGIFVIDHSDLKIKATAAATAAVPAVNLVTAGNAAAASVWAAAATATSGNPVLYFLPSLSYGYSALATATTPDSLVSIAGNLKVQIQPIVAVVNAATSDIVLDGSATVTLIGL